MILVGSGLLMFGMWLMVTSKSNSEYSLQGLCGLVVFCVGISNLI